MAQHPISHSGASISRMKIRNCVMGLCGLTVRASVLLVAPKIQSGPGAPTRRPNRSGPPR